MPIPMPTPQPPPKFRSRPFGAILVALSLTFSGLSLAQQSTDTDYQAKLQQLQDSISMLKSELHKVKNSRDQLQNDLESSEVDIGALLKKIERLKGDLASQKKQLTQLNQQKDELRAAQRSQQKHIAQQINAAYRLGQQSQVKLLLNQQQPEQVARIMKYYEYFLDARADKIDTYLDTIAELSTLEPRIVERAGRLKQDRQQLQQQHRQLQTRQGQRQQTLARLNSSIANKDQQLQQMAQDRHRLETLLAEVTLSIANLALPDNGQPFGQRRGKMDMPTRGKITHRYGSARVAGKLSWDGLFIQARAGSAVTAIHHGRVVFADYLRGHGLLTIIDHGDGYMSLYAHNQALLKETGDWVNSRETIARVGNTGGLTQAGLYFEIRHQGKPTDPARWCLSS